MVFIPFYGMYLTATFLALTLLSWPSRNQRLPFPC